MVLHHTDRGYEQQLRTLEQSLLAMAGQVEAMIGSAMQSLAEHDLELARATISADCAVDRAEIDIDELCLRLLARRQPMAADLRLVTFSLKMVTELERVGDLAVNICERTIDLGVAPKHVVAPGLLAMGEQVQSMIRRAIDAFVDGRSDAARCVVADDDEVDELYRSIVTQLMKDMQAERHDVEGSVHLLSIAKWLERIGDHATNLAEHAIFMIHGADVRHPSSAGP